MTNDAKRRSDYATEFGSALSAELAKQNMKQRDLAIAVGRSASYVNQTMTGRKTASPEWVDLVVNAMALRTPEATTLHKAAAIDHGYKINLAHK